VLQVIQLGVIGIISVRIVDEGRCAGVSTKSAAAVKGNLIHNDQRAVQPGKVTESDVMNTMSRATAISKSCGKINVTN
jgi:hypothetical protein